VAVPAARADKLVSVVNHPISKKLGLADIRKEIGLAATKRGWKVEEGGPQQIKATITANGGYEVVVNITYTDMGYSITLTDSKGFGQKGDTINGRANRWIKNLEADIAKQLEIAA
jgi:hypothetical protein